MVSILSSVYTSNIKHWKVKLADPVWNKRFLEITKSYFNENNLAYPELTRHGWNTPPRGLNRFYIEKMGVLADASFIYLNPSKYINSSDVKNYNLTLKQVSKNKYEWPQELSLPLPYYTNINEDMDSIWDGEEENRGLLQIPLTLDNICTYGFDENDRNIIDNLPNGALISTYIHPQQSLTNLEELLNYIEKNYTISFIDAKDYLKIYLSNNPRPAFIDLNSRKVYWAYLEKDSIIPIAETDLIKTDENAVHIGTSSFPPYIAIKGKNFDHTKLEQKYKWIGTLKGNIDLFEFKNQ